MKRSQPARDPGKQPAPEDVSYRWCPVCRQQVPVRTRPPDPGSLTDGSGKSDAPAAASFAPLCANCAVCMLKAAGARGTGGASGG